MDVHARRRLQRPQPFFVTFGGHLGWIWRDAEALQCDKPFDPLRADAGIQAGEDAAHAVAGEPDFACGRVAVDDGFQVADVFGEEIRTIEPGREAKAAPVGGDDVPVALEFVDDELERGGYVHPAMQQEQHGRIGSSPAANVQADAGQVEIFGARCEHVGDNAVSQVAILTRGYG